MRLKNLIIILIAIILLPLSVNAKTLDEIYNELFPNGEININAVKPIGSATETLFVKNLNSIDEKYEDISLIYNGFESEEVGKITIIQNTDEKEYNLKLKFIEPNKKILNIVNGYMEKFPIPEGNEKDLFTIRDMELINYLYAGGYNHEDTEVSNTIINYSLELQTLLNNTNLSATLQTRRGYESQFSFGAGGDLMINYKDVPYGYIDNGGIVALQVVYVPDNTKDNTKEYIAAAIKRIEEYIGKDKVSIEYAGKISELDMTQWNMSLTNIVDVDKTLNEYYKLKINNVEMDLFIEKNSSKIKSNPTLKTTDIDTNSSITTDDSSVPLDSSIKFNKYEKTEKEYKKTIEELKLEEGIVFDISLYSNSKGQYIKKLDNGNFKVYIPIDSDYKEKKLTAYYITEEGKIEEHPVTIENDFAVFTTNHFSKYTIGEIQIYT